MEPFERKPLPGLPGFWKLIGPGLIWMALAQGAALLEAGLPCENLCETIFPEYDRI